MAIGAISAGLGLASIGVKLFGAKKTYKALRKQASADAAYAAEMRNKLTQLENSRQDITDLSKNLSNPYANLGVATQATDMQIEQTDIALANTLDTIRATGAAAGGATALAQAALQSKKNVSANIEQQEVQNEKLRAQGEQYLQAQKLAEQSVVTNTRNEPKKDQKKTDEKVEAKAEITDDTESKTTDKNEDKKLKSKSKKKKSNQED